MDTTFDEKQFSRLFPDGCENHWYFLARNKIVTSLITRIAPPGARVLDIGCARGVTVKHLRDHGIECDGVDLAEAIPVHGAAEHIAYGCRAEDLEEDKRKQYKVLLLLDVLEHLPDPIDFMRDLPAAFPNATDALLMVPACPELWSGHDEYCGHLRRYKYNDIKEMSKKLGWNLVQSAHFFQSVYLPMMLMITKLGRPVKIKPPNDGLIKVPHRILATLLATEYRLLPSRLPGVSLIAHLRLKRAAASSEQRTCE